MTSTPQWRFFKAGGFDQVRLESGDELRNIEKLDQKLWAALACPTRGLEIDHRSLELIDSDKDGRIRAPELIAAVRFAVSRLRSPDDLLKGASELRLKAINDDNEAGRAVLAAARQILRVCGKEQADSIAVEDLSDPQRFFPESEFNGDGVLPEGLIADSALRQVLREIKECVGFKKDRSGCDGVGRDEIEAFFAEARLYAQWQAELVDKPEILVLGPERTAAAAAAISRVRVKVDDYFTRCRLAAFEPRIGQLVNRREEEYIELLQRDLSLAATEVSGFPLAQIQAGRALPLVGAVNPAFAGLLEALREQAVIPLLGVREDLSESEWSRLGCELRPYEEWLERKRGERVERLGSARVTELLASTAEAELLELLEQEAAAAAAVQSIDDVERLVLYHRDLHLLCQNFVSFRDFYDGDEPAIFQCGTLYIDQRACRLCVRVDDPAKHAATAGLAGAYLAYVECRRPATSETMHVVCVLTAGDSDNLMIGRNGLFYDRQGRDWDATITKIVDAPISLRQAFWAPYKKFVRLIEEQVAKRAAASNNESHATLGAVAVAATNADKTQVGDKRIDVGSVAALGVAVGAIGTFITAAVGYATGILKLGVFASLGACAGLMLLISTPSLVVAYVTLRKRNLGPILDASGWAVNASAKVNVALGQSLTHLAKLPPGARLSARERFADPGLPWKRVAALLLLVTLACRWSDGTLDRYLPKTLRVGSVTGKTMPWMKQESIRR